MKSSKAAKQSSACTDEELSWLQALADVEDSGDSNAPASKTRAVSMHRFQCPLVEVRLCIEVHTAPLRWMSSGPGQEAKVGLRQRLSLMIYLYCYSMSARLQTAARAAASCALMSMGAQRGIVATREAGAEALPGDSVGSLARGPQRQVAGAGSVSRRGHPGEAAGTRACALLRTPSPGHITVFSCVVP